MKITIENQSALLLGSGEGYGTLIDTDIVFSEVGLPVFPAKRLKGLLRESLTEVVEMLEQSGWKNNKLGYLADMVGQLFGVSGESEGSVLRFFDLTLDLDGNTTEWLNWAFVLEDSPIHAEWVSNSLTELRRQTAIEVSGDAKGVAKDNTLRSMRVLCPGRVFEGNLASTRDLSPDEKYLLVLACANLRRAGSKRNRGFGEIKCLLIDEQKDLLAEALDMVRKNLLKGGQMNVCC